MIFWTFQDLKGKRKTDYFSIKILKIESSGIYMPFKYPIFECIQSKN